MFPSDAPSSARVAIVLVNWNGWRDCIECIDSVLAQGHRDFHVFIVDNDSHDGSVEHIAAWCAEPQPGPDWRRHPGVDRYTDQPARGAVPNRVVDRADEGLPAADKDCMLTLIRSGGNLGFAGGCNVGIRAAGLNDFSCFWFLNADTVVERGALIELLLRARRQPRMGIVGSTLLFYHAPDTVHALAGGRLNRSNASSSHIGEHVPLSAVGIDESEVERELAFVCGASMLVSMQFIREIGLMQEDYFLYYEDADWSMRAQDRFKLGFARRSLVFHKHGAQSSKILPLFTAGVFYRSRLRFVRRFMPDRMAAARRTLFMEMLRHVARGRWAMARVVGSTLFGSRTAVRRSTRTMQPAPDAAPPSPRS
jgi:GT2 family glycosyltransferase